MYFCLKTFFIINIFFSLFFISIIKQHILILYRQGSIWSLEIFYIKFLIDSAFKLNFFSSNSFPLSSSATLSINFFFIYYCYEVFIYSIIITHCTFKTLRNLILLTGRKNRKTETAKKKEFNLILFYK